MTTKNNPINSATKSVMNRSPAPAKSVSQLIDNKIAQKNKKSKIEKRVFLCILSKVMSKSLLLF